MSAATAAGKPGRRPEDSLADVLAALDRHVSDANAHARREAAAAKADRHNRYTLLYIHALLALVTAPLFAWHGHVTGLTGPSWTVARVIPGVPYSLAALLFAGGVVLSLATAARHRAWIITGLAMVAAWYAFISFSFSGAVVVWINAGAPVEPNRVPATYAVIVYLHLAAVMLVHLNTVVRSIRTLPGA